MNDSDNYCVHLFDFDFFSNRMLVYFQLNNIINYRLKKFGISRKVKKVVFSLHLYKIAQIIHSIKLFGVELISMWIDYFKRIITKVMQRFLWMTNRNWFREIPLKLEIFENYGHSTIFKCWKYDLKFILTYLWNYVLDI